MVLELRWTTSRGRDTYGYNICTLYVDGRKMARCNGGGYDMEGTCIGNWLASAYADRLLSLKPEDMPEQSHWERAERPRRICRETDCAVKQIEEHDALSWLSPSAETCPRCGAETDIDYHDGKRVDDGRYLYGLRFVDPDYDARTAKLEHADGCFTKTEDEGKTLGELSDAGKLVDLDLIRAAYKQTSPHATDRHTVPSIDGACGKSSVERIAEAIGIAFEWVPQHSKKVSVYIVHDKRA